MESKSFDHVLVPATALLGFCLLVVTSVHVADKAEDTFIDDLTYLISSFLTFACICSFMVIRRYFPKREKALSIMADVLFFLSLGVLFLIIVLLAIGNMK